MTREENTVSAPYTLTETSESLAGTLQNALSQHFGTDIYVGPVNTGGGTMVLCIDLSQDGRGIGRQLWLTREDDWYLGFYDGAGDDADEFMGVVVSLPMSAQNAENAHSITGAVVGILRRLGVSTLQ